MFISYIQKYIKDKMWKRWLFHAADFQSLMYPCFTFCRFLGIFPYKINASIFEVSKPHYIVSTIVIFVYCVSYALVINGILISGTLDHGEVTRNLEGVCFFTLNSLTAIVTHILSVPRMRLLQTILEISSKLPTKSYQKLSRFIHIKDIFGTILLIVHGYIYTYKVRIKYIDFEWTFLPVLSVVFARYGSLLVFQMDMLYINCVCILKACFKKVNDDLMHIQKLIKDTKPFIPSLICYMQKNQFFLIELRTLMKQHLMISRTVQRMNIIFSVQLVASVIGTFSEITLELYFYVVRWQGELLITLDRQLLDAFLSSMTCYIIKIILLVWACETGKNQVQKISTTIYDVLNSTKNKQIKAELQLFSLQILHCQNTFSAKGLTVDATLLRAMMGGITTYMIILMQFLITSHSCDEKFGINIINNTVT